MPIDLTRKYELEQQRAIKRFAKQIRQIYEEAILEISIVGASTKLKPQLFSLNLYPFLNDRIESTVGKMHQKLYQQIVKSVEQSWNLSNKKNDQIVDKRLAGKKPTTKGRQILYDPNKQAYNAFISRKEKGLNISERVWNTLDPFKKEMEQALGLSINKGQSAASMATEVKQYLNNPDKLFRRVRNEEGKLVLSKGAREYHPGQGIYRSSYKNALRLTATENNIAYRSADHERWKTLPFVTGIRINTSNNHPEFDICDNVKGLYPKDFKFSGWHPFCRCFAVPEMLSDEEYEKLEDAILRGEQIKAPDHLVVKQPPAAFKKWVSDNRERIEGWKNKPYWATDNLQYYSGKVQPNPVKFNKGLTVEKFVPAKSIKEAELYAKEVVGVKYANFKGIDLKIANDINKSVFNIKQVMPDIRTNGIGSAQAANRELKAKVVEVYKKSDWYKTLVDKYGQQTADRQATRFANDKASKVGSGTIAWSQTKSTIRIPGAEVIDVSEYTGVFVSDKYGKSKDLMDAMIKKNRDSGWFTKSAEDFGYIMSHEIGHEIDKTLNFVNNPSFKAIYKREHDLGIKSVSERLSTYGATAGGKASHKPMEMIAEAWAEFMTSKEPRSLAKEIGELMLKTYYEDFVQGSGTNFTTWKSEIMKIVQQ